MPLRQARSPPASEMYPRGGAHDSPHLPCLNAPGQPLQAEDGEGEHSGSQGQQQRRDGSQAEPSLQAAETAVAGWLAVSAAASEDGAGGGESDGRGGRGGALQLPPAGPPPVDSHKEEAALAGDSRPGGAMRLSETFSFDQAFGKAAAPGLEGWAPSPAAAAGCADPGHL